MNGCSTVGPVVNVTTLSFGENAISTWRINYTSYSLGGFGSEFTAFPFNFADLHGNCSTALPLSHSPEEKITMDPCYPNIFPPPEITSLQPSWAGCAVSGAQVWDPPSALTMATHLDIFTATEPSQFMSTAETAAPSNTPESFPTATRSTDTSGPTETSTTIQSSLLSTSERSNPSHPRSLESSLEVFQDSSSLDPSGLDYNPATKTSAARASLDPSNPALPQDSLSDFYSITQVSPLTLPASIAASSVRLSNSAGAGIDALPSPSSAGTSTTMTSPPSSGSVGSASNRGSSVKKPPEDPSTVNSVFPLQSPKSTSTPVGLAPLILSGLGDTGPGAVSKSSNQLATDLPSTMPYHVNGSGGSLPTQQMFMGPATKTHSRRDGNMYMMVGAWAIFLACGILLRM